MYQRVLVPLDGSHVSESVLPKLADLISKFSPEIKVEVTLFQVLSPVEPRYIEGYAAPDVAYTEQQMEESKRKAIDYLSKTGEALRGGGAAVLPRVAFGKPWDEIVKAAEEVDADLIAMSTHGRSGIGRWAFGSVTDRVLRAEGRIPILLIRAQD